MSAFSYVVSLCVGSGRVQVFTESEFIISRKKIFLVRKERRNNKIMDLMNCISFDIYT